MSRLILIELVIVILVAVLSPVVETVAGFRKRGVRYKFRIYLGQFLSISALLIALLLAEGRMFILAAGFLFGIIMYFPVYLYRIKKIRKRLKGSSIYLRSLDYWQGMVISTAWVVITVFCLVSEGMGYILPVLFTGTMISMFASEFLIMFDISRLEDSMEMPILIEKKR